MRRKGKRFISAGLSLLLCLGMAACGNTQTGDAQKETQGNEAEDNEKQEKPELVFWELPYGPADTYEPALLKIIDEYNSGGHSATVRLQMLSWSGFMEQYQTSIAAGSPPDITSSISYRIANWIEAGEVLDITDIVEKWEQEDDEVLDDFLPGTIDIGKKTADIMHFLTLPTELPFTTGLTSWRMSLDSTTWISRSHGKSCLRCAKP